MSPAQTQLYFRTWQAAAQAHGWTNKAGVAAALQSHRSGVVWESPELNRVLAAIYELAFQSAQIRACGMTPQTVKHHEHLGELAEFLEAEVSVTADDLRHACSAFATGRNVSSRNFTNADFDKVLALLRVLADPQNLQHLAAFENVAEDGERRRHVHVINQADECYWQKIARDKFGHADLDRLTLDQLRQLSLTIRNRQPRTEPVSA